LIDVGLEVDILKNYDFLKEYQLYSLIITMVVGYSIHFFILYLQRFRLNFIVKEFVQLFAYLTVVMVWRTWWDGRILNQNFYKIYSYYKKFKLLAIRFRFFSTSNWTKSCDSHIFVLCALSYNSYVSQSWQQFVWTRWIRKRSSINAGFQ
jgi:hypothetical protein